MNLGRIDELSGDEAKALLRWLFERCCRPAFGALPGRETDLVLFEAMHRAGVVSREASLYDLMTGLRIGRTKARNLMFDLAIRADPGAGALDCRVKEAIAHPRGFVLDGSFIALGIEDPLVQAHMKDRVRALGHLTDGSFAAALVKLKPGALAALVEALMSPDELQNFGRAMRAAGLARDKTLRTALITGLTHLAAKTVGADAAQAGRDLLEHVAAQVADFVQPKLETAIDSVRDVLAEAFDIAPTGGPPRARGL